MEADLDCSFMGMRRQRRRGRSIMWRNVGLATRGMTHLQICEDKGMG